MTDTIFMLEPRLQEAIPQITEQNRLKSPNEIASNHRKLSFTKAGREETPNFFPAFFHY